MNCDLVFSGMALHRGLDGDALLRDSELVECVVISDFFFFFILLFPIPFFISRSITAQGSRNLFRLNIVWNVKTSMHILMIKLIPFYEDATHLDISPQSVRKQIWECVRFLSSKGRGEREDGLSVRKRDDCSRCAL